MLHLDARIHLDEEPFPGIQVVEILDGPRVVVADLLRNARGGLAQFRAHPFIQIHRGRDLDHFLVAALDRAIPLVQVEHVSMPISEHLHFDVLGARNVFLEEHRRISKGALGFPLRLIEQGIQVAGLAHDAHAAPPAAKRRLDDQRESDLRRDLQRVGAIAHRILRAGQRGHLQLLRQRARRHLVSHQIQQFCLRAHELDPGLPAGPGKTRVLGQKSIARMNQIHPMLPGDGNDPLDIQIRAHRAFPLAHEVGFVRLEPVHRETILLRVDGNRSQPQLRGRAKDANGDFGAVGNEQFFLAGRRRNAHSAGGGTHRGDARFKKACAALPVD